MQHFTNYALADFGIIKQQNKLRKKLNEVDPNFLSSGSGTKEKSRLAIRENLSSAIESRYEGKGFLVAKNIEETKQLPNSFKGQPDLNNYIKGAKQVNRDAIKATTVDPLTMPYEKKLDWTAKQSMGDVLKSGLKTKPVRKSADESVLDGVKRGSRDYERYTTLISPDKRTTGEKIQDEYVKPLRRAARMAGWFM